MLVALRLYDESLVGHTEGVRGDVLRADDAHTGQEHSLGKSTHWARALVLANCHHWALENAPKFAMIS